MKNRMICLILVVMALAGCHSMYQITLTNGTRLTAASKPKLVGNNYVFKDAMGREVNLPAGRVQEIQPASMAKEEKSPFIPTPSH
jgi:hypothetical protein